jgi:D-arabinose 1-dehydrogenase-like Zn-dependent alcohol dehydrogenase
VSRLETGATEAAPLLCAGLIGWRACSMAMATAGADSRRIGLFGHGASAHVIAQVVVHQRRGVFACTRPGDHAAQGLGRGLGRGLGALWAGGSDERAPVELDAALIFAPVGALVPAALAAVRRALTVLNSPIGDRADTDGAGTHVLTCRLLLVTSPPRHPIAARARTCRSRRRVGSTWVGA